ncbi:hypothetical protein ACJ3XI_11980 [Litorimonas sp. RW-G-Af-16]|uniref:hypothetical protein n=1 Tax=Litorimonas sp. RW-G-Af-16 TaxID=3241168 RepID=UPI00390C93AC
MTHTSKLMKGLLAASALTVFSAGSAYAQITPNNYTAAGTPVSNTFTLNYNVGGVPQPPIDTDDPGDPNGPTVFTVDRLINLTVDSNGDATVAPGATDEQLTFSVLNTGNDTQGYALSIVEETTAPDTINTDDPASAAPVIVYYVDDGDGAYEPGVDDGVAITYDPANPPQLAPDALIWVTIVQDIPASAVDGDQADITLIADTLDAGTTTPSTADGDSINSLTGAAENVLADGSSTANEAANAGDDSATGAYIVAAANITALKDVDVFSEDGANCTTIPGTPTGGYSVPNACVEYVISVTNTGSQSATNIVVNDVLPDELEFQAAVFGGAFTGGSFASPALPGVGTDCDSGACVVNLQGATLPAPTGGATETVGTVTIRALVK